MYVGCMAATLTYIATVYVYDVNTILTVAITYIV